MRIVTLAMCCVGLVLAAGLVNAQTPDKSKRPSPPASANCDMAGGTITVDYSSPRAKGRKIYGDVVPYGQVWRAGANEATTFVTTKDVMVGGKAVPAGSYTLFAVPNADKWTLVISKKTKEWGTPYPGAEYDLARVEMTATKLPAMVENFKIALDKNGDGCTLHMDWEMSSASVAITSK